MNQDSNREDRVEREHAIDAMALSMGLSRHPAAKATVVLAGCLCLSCGAQARSVEELTCGH